MTDTPNPLPKADDNSRLQRRSIVSFQEILPGELFVFRDERVDDAGVDGSLEILIDAYYTNMRAQVQLKSTKERNARQDGVLTFSIETSSLMDHLGYMSCMLRKLTSSIMLGLLTKIDDGLKVVLTGKLKSRFQYLFKR